MKSADQLWKAKAFANRSEYFRALIRRDLMEERNLKTVSATTLKDSAGILAIGGDARKDLALLYE